MRLGRPPLLPSAGLNESQKQKEKKKGKKKRTKAKEIERRTNKQTKVKGKLKKKRKKKDRYHAILEVTFVGSILYDGDHEGVIVGKIDCPWSIPLRHSLDHLLMCHHHLLPLHQQRHQHCILQQRY